LLQRSCFKIVFEDLEKLALQGDHLQLMAAIGHVMGLPPGYFERI
jgi:hypothetical protein